MDALRASGARLYLATAKPHHYATKITAHFKIAERMTREFGPELDGTRNWKGDLLAFALAETGEDPKRSVMVGDRHHDIAAAAEVGMPSLAAAWGYGSKEEWTGTKAILDHIAELPEAVAALDLG
jgi:phosphoglycolate phosphatase